MRRELKGILSVFALIAALGFGLQACGSTTQDSGHGDINTGQAEIVAMPDGFRNVAHKCDGPNMVYSASRGAGDNAGAVAVAPNDPRCPQARGQAQP